MEHCYTIEEGKLLLCNSIRGKLSLYFSYLYQLFKFVFGIVTLFITVYLTLVIYRKCITQITLNECIPLGSIFATFGSAVISVLSIYCGEQKSMFEENLTILRGQVSGLETWQRWPFLKRFTKRKMTFLHSNFYILSNPQIIFETKKRKLRVPIPSCSADFKDLPVTVNIFKMLRFYKEYSNSIFCFHNAEQQKDLLIFDCILMIYKNIIRYKLGVFFIWIGADFIFSSIIFSFFYRQIDQFLSSVAAYF